MVNDYTTSVGGLVATSVAFSLYRTFVVCTCFSTFNFSGLRYIHVCGVTQRCLRPTRKLHTLIKFNCCTLRNCIPICNYYD